MSGLDKPPPETPPGRDSGARKLRKAPPGPQRGLGNRLKVALFRLTRKLHIGRFPAELPGERAAAVIAAEAPLLLFRSPDQRSNIVKDTRELSYRLGVDHIARARLVRQMVLLKPEERLAFVNDALKLKDVPAKAVLLDALRVGNEELTPAEREPLAKLADGKILAFLDPAERSDRVREALMSNDSSKFLALAQEVKTLQPKEIVALIIASNDAEPYDNGRARSLLFGAVRELPARDLETVVKAVPACGDVAFDMEAIHREAEEYPPGGRRGALIAAEAPLLLLRSPGERSNIVKDTRRLSYRLGVDHTARARLVRQMGLLKPEERLAFVGDALKLKDEDGVGKAVLLEALKAGSEELTPAERQPLAKLADGKILAFLDPAERSDRVREALMSNDSGKFIALAQEVKTLQPKEIVDLIIASDDAKPHNTNLFSLLSRAVRELPARDLDTVTKAVPACGDIAGTMDDYAYKADLLIIKRPSAPSFDMHLTAGVSGCRRLDRRSDTKPQASNRGAIGAAIIGRGLKSRKRQVSRDR